MCSHGSKILADNSEGQGLIIKSRIQNGRGNWLHRWIQKNPRNSTTPVDGLFCIMMTENSALVVRDSIRTENKLDDPILV